MGINCRSLLLAGWASAHVFFVLISVANLGDLHSQEKTPEEVLKWIGENQGEYDTEEESVVALRLDRTRGIDPGFIRDGLNDQDLQRLELMPNIRQLTLENRHSITDACLPHIAKLKFLRKLNLNQTSISGKRLDALATLPLLHDLSLDNCRDFEDEGAATLKNLKRLIAFSANASTGNWMNLSGWRQELESEVRSKSGFPSPSSKLNRFRSGITNIGLSRIAEVSELRSLSLANTKITDEGVEVLKKLTHLTNLNLNGTVITDKGLVAIGQLSKLKSLHLATTYITDKGMECIGQLEDLRELSIAGTLVSLDGLRKLKGCKKLQSLNLGETRMASEVAEVLQQFPNLENVRLVGTNVTFSGLVSLNEALPGLDFKNLLLSSNFADLSFELANRSTKLSRLNLSINVPPSNQSNRRIQDQDLAFLRDRNVLDDLAVLELQGSQVSDIGMEQLSGLPKLQQLVLTDSNVTDAGLVHLRESNQLLFLPIKGTRITLDGIINLVVKAQGRSIAEAITVAGVVDWRSEQPPKIFDLHGCRTTDSDIATLAGLDEVDTLLLQDNPISDIGLSRLTSIKSLRQLWVNGRLITGNGLASLKRIKTLETLWLTDTQATEEDLLQLADLPRLRVLNISGMPLTANATNYIKSLKSLELLIVDSAAMYRIDPQAIRTANPKLTIVFSQKRALAAVRGRERFEKILPQGYHRSLEMGCVRTDVINNPLVEIFGDAHFEQAIDLQLSRKRKLFNTHWKELPTLKRVSLYGSQVKKGDLHELQYLPKLLQLDLSEAQVEEGVLEQVEKLTSLEAISFGGYDTHIGDEVLERISKLTNLKELGLDRTKITDAGMKHLMPLKKLQKLRLREVPIDEGIGNVSQLLDLQEIDLYHTLVTDDSLKHLYHLSNMQRIQIDGTLVSQKGVDLLKKQLSKAVVDSGIISEDARAITRQIARLRLPMHRDQRGEIFMLDLRNCSEVSLVIPHLANLKRLQQLRLDDHSAKRVLMLSELEQTKLHQLPQLNALYLAGCSVDTEFLLCLQKLPQLRHLTLRGAKFPNGFAILNRLPQLQGLGLEATSLGDDDFCKLTALTQLKFLSLDSTAVTKASVHQFEKLGSLEMLSLRNTSLTDEDLESFRKSHPKSKVLVGR